MLPFIQRPQPTPPRSLPDPGFSHPCVTNGSQAPARRGGRILTLLQLTDPHLFARARDQLLGITTSQSFKSVLRGALATVPTDALVLTGDLVQDASIAGYRRLRRLLDATRVRYDCIPGNHDSLNAMQQVFGTTETLPVSFRRFGGWTLIFLDSTEPGHEGGRLGATRLALLERILMADTSPAVIFLHHHPVAIRSRWIDGIGVADGAALLACCDRHARVKAVAFGHIHQEFAQQRGGYLLLGTPSTCLQFKPHQDRFALDDRAPGFREIQLHPDGVIQSRVRRCETYPERAIPDAMGY